MIAVVVHCKLDVLDLYVINTCDVVQHIEEKHKHVVVNTCQLSQQSSTRVDELMVYTRDECCHLARLTFAGACVMSLVSVSCINSL